MMLYRPSELRAFLNSLGISAKKSLSQNFLIDKNILDKICNLADIHPGDQIIEIGPGPGALTEALLERGAQVLAIEKDKTFAQALRRFSQNLVVLEEDFLTLPLEKYLQNNQKYKVVANLPYQITTPILTKLAPLHSYISSLTVMVQKEVAKRFVAPPNSKDYSSITLFLQFYGKTSYGFTVEPTCFYPQPNVQSAVVRIDLAPPPSVSPELFFHLTRSAFKQRRKMLRTSLKTLYPQIETALSALGFPTTVRPEQLTLSDFIALFKMLH